MNNYYIFIYIYKHAFETKAKLYGFILYLGFKYLSV